MRPRLLKVLPPIWFALFVATALVAHYYFPASHAFNFYVPSWGPTAGFVVALAGFVLSSVASRIFAYEKTEILPTSPVNRVLVTRGPYRYTRNPMYLGMVLTILGIAVALSTLPMFLAALADFFILNFIFIPLEEEKMERQFGDQYRAYKTRVRRWL